MNKITTKNNVSTNTRELIMGNLALSDEILLKIEKPVRYIGNEVNMVRKDCPLYRRGGKRGCEG